MSQETMSNLDFNYFKTCTAMAQLCALLFNLIVACIELFSTQCLDVQCRQHLGDCFLSDIYFVVSSNCVVTMLILLVVYSTHVVEKYGNFHWLVIESVAYIVLAMANLFLSLLIGNRYEQEHVASAVFGFLSVCPLSLLAIVKMKQVSYKEPAQEEQWDPDGNHRRVLLLNERFRNKNLIIGAGEDRVKTPNIVSATTEVKSATNETRVKSTMVDQSTTVNGDKNSNSSEISSESSRLSETSPRSAA